MSRGIPRKLSKAVKIRFGARTGYKKIASADLTFHDDKRSVMECHEIGSFGTARGYLKSERATLVSALSQNYEAALPEFVGNHINDFVFTHMSASEVDQRVLKYNDIGGERVDPENFFERLR